MMGVLAGAVNVIRYIFTLSFKNQMELLIRGVIFKLQKNKSIQPTLKLISSSELKKMFENKETCSF